jgi:hypothetical protein
MDGPDLYTRGLCAICRRQWAGAAHASDWAEPHGNWLHMCDDPDCVRIAFQVVKTMRQDRFSKLEAMATKTGGAQGGKYLDEIGKTDLATLSEAEFETFCRRVVAGYRIALKELIDSETVPF